MDDRPLLAKQIQGKLGQSLVRVGPLPLGERPLRARHAVLHREAEPARRGEAQALGLDVELGDLLAVDGVLVQPAVARELHQLAERDLQGHGAAQRDAGALVHQRGDGHGPAVAHAADHGLVGNARLLHEDLVELGLAGDGHQRPRLDARQAHVDEQARDAFVFGRVGVGTHEQLAPVGHVAERRPHLLAVDDEVVAVGHRSGRE